MYSICSYYVCMWFLVFDWHEIEIHRKIVERWFEQSNITSIKTKFRHLVNFASSSLWVTCKSNESGKVIIKFNAFHLANNHSEQMTEGRENSLLQQWTNKINTIWKCYIFSSNTSFVLIVHPRFKHNSLKYLPLCPGLCLLRKFFSLRFYVNSQCIWFCLYECVCGCAMCNGKSMSPFKFMWFHVSD